MLDLKYGDSKVEIDLSKAKSVTVLNENPMDEITDLKAEFIKGVTKDMINSKSLKEVVSKGDKVTIVISDLTRFWQRQDLICEQLVDYLVEEIGIDYDDIAIVVAIGTHRMQTEEELCQLASKKVYDKVKVVNHDCDADDLVCVGKTKIGTEVYVNPLVVGRKVIMVTGTVHHIMAGFGGGRKSVIPGVAGRETIKQNHIRCLSETEKKTDPRVASRLLDNNPVNEDMNQAGELVDVAFGINIVVNTKSKHSKLFCGNFHDAWLASCKYVDDCYGVKIEKEADIVIASCGGYPKDINLYQSTKSIFNAARAVKKGGTVIFLAECREGGGAPDFFSWIDPLKRGVLDEELRANFTIGGYIFYALCEAIAKSDMLMLSEIDPNFVKDLNIDSYKNIDELLEKVDFEGKDVCILPYGGSVVPLLQK
ncbi:MULTISPECIES: nickel-dependent lactate racemase [Clostridia]|uniref:nickel-dependent lactate racemase n=1 Tax=Clostridia TaxID=186801 RepID=UPI0018AB52F7|nr:nickel-dependent lactate racemase [Clostridium sp. 1001270J_160509_D11]